jgi:hypothetical protein
VLRVWGYVLAGAVIILLVLSGSAYSEDYSPKESKDEAEATQAKQADHSSQQITVPSNMRMLLTSLLGQLVRPTGRNFATPSKDGSENELAHYQVLFDPKKPEGKRYKLIPHLANPASPSNGLEIIGLHLNELKMRVRVFKLLYSRIRDFVVAAERSGKFHQPQA